MGRRIFAKGANWIPADSFLTRVSKEKYSILLSLAKEASMNFIRVWGGGSYESDIFYELCDKYGLLVWQDFMFACASYPEHKEFLDNVSIEIEENVKRLQHHPSIALWCGNNENEWIWYQEKKKSYKSMSGYQIYSSLIPDILKEIDPNRPYWETSPFSFEDDPNSVLSGNRHQWDLWSNWKDYNTVKNDFSLFVTEFGFQGPANQSTFEKVIPAEERNPQSYLFEFHNKQVEGNERMFKFLSGHLPVRTEWKDFIYLAQLNQGLALKTCVEHWRLYYPHCNGSIIWQLNDCWPVSSWALVDSDLQPKLSYYLVKNSFQDPFLKFTMNQDELHLHLINNKEIFNGYLVLSEINLPSGKTVSKKIKLKAEKQKTLLKVIKLNDELEKGKLIAAATLYDENEEFLHRAVFTQPEWKYMKLPKARVRWKLVNKKESQYISLKTDRPAFYVSIFAEGLQLKNNAVSILPGEELLLPVEKNFMKDKVKLNIFSTE